MLRFCISVLSMGDFAAFVCLIDVAVENGPQEWYSSAV